MAVLHVGGLFLACSSRRNRLVSACLLTKTDMDRQLRLWIFNPDPVIILGFVGTIWTPLLVLSTSHSCTRVCRASSMPFPVTRSTIYPFVFRLCRLISENCWSACFYL